MSILVDLGGLPIRALRLESGRLRRRKRLQSPGTLCGSAFSQYNPAEFNAALGALEEYRGVDDVSVVGCVGSLIVATRGAVGPGEVLLSVRGSKEAYLAWSDQPLPRGTEVLVIDTRGARTVLVEPWIARDFTTQLP